MLPVQVSEGFLQSIFDAVKEDPKTEVTVDLGTQTVTLNATGAQETFEISAYKKQNLQNGFDDIDYLLNIKSSIEGFAETRPF